MNSIQTYNILSGSNSVAAATAYAYSSSFTTTITTPSFGMGMGAASNFHQTISYTYTYKFNPEKIKTLEDVIELLSVFNLFDVRFNASDLSKIEQLDFIAAKGLITKE